MKRIAIGVLAGLVLALAPGLGWADTATGEGSEAKPTEPAPKPVVQIDVTETIEGRPYPAGYATYYIRKKLRENGFRAWSVRMLRIFEKEHAREVAAAKAAGQPEPVLLEKEKPAPQLVIRGEVRSELDRTSKFYGQDLAFVYKTEVNLSILDADGKELHTIHIADEFGRRDRKAARRDVMRRAGLFAAAEVLAAPPIAEKLSEAQRAAAQSWIEKINAKRKDGSR